MDSRTIILDLGDVLFHWSTSAHTALSPKALHAVILSPTWGALERDELSEEEALRAISTELAISSSTILSALNECRITLRVNTDLLKKLEELKKSQTGRLRIYAMTNIARVDFAILKTLLPDWGLFDAVFTSFEAGMRKPELRFYDLVLKSTGVDPSKTIFVDDKIDNVIAAASSGMSGILFENTHGLFRKLHNMLGDPVLRGREYLRHNAGKHFSTVENGPSIHDAFSQFLLYEITGDASLINLSTSNASETAPKNPSAPTNPLTMPARAWNYFLNHPVGTTPSFPDDVDTTSCALLALSPPNSSVHAVLDAMLANRNTDNLVQTYFSPTRPRVDPVVLTNVLRAFYAHNRGAELAESLAYVRRTLLHRGYLNGTLHYYSAESFLFFVSRLVAANPLAAEVQALREPLVERLRERVGRRDDALAVAMRVLACQAFDVWAESDLEYLKELQEVDGGWEDGWVCRFGRSRKRIGNRGLVTAYAVEALINA